MWHALKHGSVSICFLGFQCRFLECSSAYSARNPGIETFIEGHVVVVF